MPQLQNYTTFYLSGFIRSESPRGNTSFVSAAIQGFFAVNITQLFIFWEGKLRSMNIRTHTKACDYI